MRIYFIIRTNRRTPMINYAVFQLGDSDPIYIDRDTTYFSSREIGNGLYETDMEWRSCYMLDGEEAHYFGDGIPENVVPRLVGMELEEDAGSDYIVDVQEFSFDTVPEDVSSEVFV